MEKVEDVVDIGDMVTVKVLDVDKMGKISLSMKPVSYTHLSVDVEDVCYAVPCGMPVGIYLKYRGVMVIGTGKVTDEKGGEAEPA